MPSLFLSVLGSIIAFFAASSYLRSIIKGETRPHRITWGGWTLVGVLGLWASYDGGAKIGLLVAAVFAVLVAITFAFSLLPKYGKPGGERTDYFVGALAAAGIVAWRVIHFSPAIAATIAVFADAVFLWFTLRETWRQPETEALRPWVLGSVAEALGLIALGNYSYAAAAYPVYILIGNIAVVAVLLVRKQPLAKRFVRAKKAS